MQKWIRFYEANLRLLKISLMLQSNLQSGLLKRPKRKRHCMNQLWLLVTAQRQSYIKKNMRPPYRLLMRLNQNTLLNLKNMQNL